MRHFFLRHYDECKSVLFLSPGTDGSFSIQDHDFPLQMVKYYLMYCAIRISLVRTFSEFYQWSNLFMNFLQLFIPSCCISFRFFSCIIFACFVSISADRIIPSPLFRR